MSWFERPPDERRELLARLARSAARDTAVVHFAHRGAATVLLPAMRKEEAGMDEQMRALMGAPSVEREACPFCGRRAEQRHHVVPRSLGGSRGPTVTVCGLGNASGCHGLLHSHRLHLRWRGCWEWLRTEGPTKYCDALLMDGWRRLL